MNFNGLFNGYKCTFPGLLVGRINENKIKVRNRVALKNRKKQREVLQKVKKLFGTEDKKYNKCFLSIELNK